MSKALSEKIVEQCIENPKYAFLLVPLGLVLIYWGVSDAKYYRALVDRPTQTMTDVSIVTKANHRGFMAPFVVGTSEGKEVSIAISPKSARTMDTTGEMQFIETADNSGEYHLRSSVEGQANSILFSMAGIPINFIALLGLAITIGACGWGGFAKPQPTTAEEGGEASSES